jgi:hypothetical protein
MKQYEEEKMSNLSKTAGELDLPFRNPTYGSRASNELQDADQHSFEMLDSRQGGNQPQLEYSDPPLLLKVPSASNSNA